MAQLEQRRSAPGHGADQPRHGRHLLASLGSKLAILGPPRIIAEVPEELAPARGLFSAGGYAEEATLTDYVWRPAENGRSGHDNGCLVIPVTIDDLAANGLLEGTHPLACWERSVETLTARKDDIGGLAVASDERVEACLLYVRHSQDQEEDACSAGASAPTTNAGVRASAPDVEIVSLRSFVEDDGERLTRRLSRLSAQGPRTFRFPKVHPSEFAEDWLHVRGFSPARAHRLYAATPRADG